MQPISHYPITIMQFIPVCLSRAKQRQQPLKRKRKQPATDRTSGEGPPPNPTAHERRAGDPPVVLASFHCPGSSLSLAVSSHPSSPRLQRLAALHLSPPPRSHPWPPPAPGSGSEPTIAGSLPGLRAPPSLALSAPVNLRGVSSPYPEGGGRSASAASACLCDPLRLLLEDRPLAAVAKAGSFTARDSRRGAVERRLGLLEWLFNWGDWMWCWCRRISPPCGSNLLASSRGRR